MPRLGSRPEGIYAPGGGFWPPEAYPRGSNAPTSTAAVGTGQGAYPGIADSIFDAPGVNVAGAGPHQYSEPDDLPSAPSAPSTQPRGQVSYDFGTDPIAFLIANGFMPPIASSSYDDAGTPRGSASDLANLGGQDIAGEPIVQVNGNPTQRNNGLTASSDRVNIPIEDTGDNPKPQLSGNEGFLGPDLSDLPPVTVTPPGMGRYPVPGVGGKPAGDWRQNASRSYSPNFPGGRFPQLSGASAEHPSLAGDWTTVSSIPGFSGFGSIGSIGGQYKLLE